MHFPVSGVDVFPLIPPLIAFVISFLTSMGGVSGAFLLLPFQVSVLGFSSPAVSPTNMIFNIVGIPGGVYRYFREGRMAWPLALTVITGTLPGIFIGVIVRIKYLPEPGAFKFFIGCVLAIIGIQLLYQGTEKFKRGKEKNNVLASKFNEMVKSVRNREGDKNIDGHAAGSVVRTVKFSLRKCEYEFWGERFSFNTYSLAAVAFVVGIISGAYGVGGGSILAPFCIAVLGLRVYTVAGAILLSTFFTSITGVSFYYIAAFSYESTGLAIRPDWMLGLLFGIGGIAGMYCGARAQKYVPERWIKGVLGLAIISLSFRYIVQFLW